MVGGMTGIAKIVNDNKAPQSQLEKLKCHKGYGLYFAPYKGGREVSKKKKR